MTLTVGILIALIGSVSTVARLSTRNGFEYAVTHRRWRLVSHAVAAVALGSAAGGVICLSLLGYSFGLVALAALLVPVNLVVLVQCYRAAQAGRSTTT